MLGKHVNVSARNQKLFKKVFCVFMAIVLVGLMVPHGLAAQLSAYAKAAEQTPAAETQADNPQESTPAEEVNTPESQTPVAAPVPSNEGEPTNDEYLIYVDAGDGYFDSNKRTEWVDINWVGDPVEGHLYKKAYYHVDTSLQPETTYRNILDGAVGLFAEEGEHFAIVAPGTATYVGFKYDNKDLIDLEVPVASEETLKVCYKQSMSLLPAGDLTLSNQYKETFSGSTSTYSWEKGTAISLDDIYAGLFYGNSFTVNGAVLTINDFFGDELAKYEVIPVDGYRFKAFFDNEGNVITSGTLTAPLTLNVTNESFEEDLTNVHFVANKDDVDTTNTFFKNSNPPAKAQFTTMYGPKVLTYKTEDFDIYGYTCAGIYFGDELSSDVFGFMLSEARPIPAFGDYKYYFDRWEVSTDGVNFETVTSDEQTVTVTDIYFRACFEENHALTFSMSLQTSGGQLMVKKNEAAAEWTAVTAPVYYKKEFHDSDKYRMRVNSSTNNFEVGKLDGGFVAKELYQVINMKDGYKTGKWTTSTGWPIEPGVPETINQSWNIIANIQVALTFKTFNRTDADPNVGYVVIDGEEDPVAVAYGYPGDEIYGAGESGTLTIDETDYVAVPADPETYEFSQWDTMNTVPNEPKDFKVTFKPLSSVAFTINILDAYKDNVNVTQKIAEGEAEVIDTTQTFYFSDTYSYWKNENGDLVIGIPSTESTYHVFSHKLTTGSEAYILFDKWQMEDADLPEMANAKQLVYQEDAYDADIYFNVLPKVTFAMTHEQGAVEDGTKIVYTAPGSTDPVEYQEPLYFPDGSKAWLSTSGDLKVGDPAVPANQYVFSAISNGHYQKVKQWRVGNTVIEEQTTATFEMNVEYTATADYKNINNMKLSGFFTKTYEAGNIAGSATADIYLAGVDSPHDQGAKIDTVTFNVTADNGYTLEGLPQYCYVWVNGYADGYITENAPEAGFLIETTDRSNQNISFMSTAYNFVSTGYDSGTWTDNFYNAKTITATGFIVDGTDLVAGASGGILTFDLKAGDKICLNDLKVYDGATEVPPMSATVEQYAGDTSKRSVTLTGKRELHHLFETLEADVDSAKVTVAAGTVLSRLDLHNSTRTITFEVDETGRSEEKPVGLGDGQFLNTDTHSQLDAPMGTFYECSALTTETLSVDNGGSSAITVTADAYDDSVFRKWMLNVQTGKHYITEDTTITCRFALNHIYINFDKSADSDAEVDDPADPTTARQISNDSTFLRTAEESHVSTLHVKSMFDASDQYGTDTEFNLKITDQAKSYKYKFQWDPENNLYSFDEMTKYLINEENYPGCEQADYPVTIKYIIVERDHYDVSVDLGNGRFTPNETVSNLESIPLGYGGQGTDGAWISTDNKVWTNTVYEEFPVEKLRNETINKLTWDKVFNVSAFFTGWDWIVSPDYQEEPEKAVCDLKWNAAYDDPAVWIGGTVTDSSSANTPLSGAEIRLISEVDLDPSHAKTLKTTTASDGTFKRQDNDKTKPGRAIQIYKNAYGQLSAGHATHIQHELNTGLVEQTNLDYEFKLDKGYTWLPNSTKIGGTQWRNEYSDTYGCLQLENTPAVEGDLAKVSGWLYLVDETTGSYPVNSGNQFHIYTNDESENAFWNDGFKDPAVYDNASHSYDYVLWSNNLYFMFDTAGETLGVSRIDYYVPWDEYISIYGEIAPETTHFGDDQVLTAFHSKDKLDGLHYDGSEVLRKEAVKVTNEATGKLEYRYYLVFKQGAESAGTVLYTADTLSDDYDIDEYSYYLDERFLLDGTENADIHGPTTDAEGNKADAVLPDAIHVTGHVKIQDPEDPAKYTDAEHADVSFSPEQNMPGYNYEWNDDNHGYAFTNEDGNYTLKLLKSSDEEKAGGFVWFHMVGDETEYAQDGHKLIYFDEEGNEVKIKHDADIPDIDGQIDVAGANVKITAADYKESVNGFEITTLSNGYVVDRYSVFEDIDARNFFSKEGKFRTTYDEQGRHLLEYHYDAANFQITVRPLVNDGFTYWSWKLTDCEEPYNTTTLNDFDDVELDVMQSDEPYIFTVYATKGAELTAGGTSEGHAMWDIQTTITAGSAQESYTYPQQIPAGEDFVYTFPICNHPVANEVEEPIHTAYNFNGEKFVLDMESAFEDETVLYSEHWEFNPVPVEGYYFVGMSMNGVEMTPGEVIELNTQDDLNLVAHYLPIPEDVGAQTGDANNMWWLVGLAVLAMLGVAYGASRKQKGIRC